MQIYRYSWLLVALIALILLSPLLEAHDAGEITLASLSLIVIAFAVYATAEHPGQFRISLALGAIWFVAYVAFAIIEKNALAAISDVLMIMFLVYAMSVIIRMLFQAKESDLDLLSASACVYLMIAVAWALSYDLIELVAPGSYVLVDPAGMSNVPSPAAMLYFSLATITTLGYGDLVPLTPMAGIWATLETVTGVLYITVLISRLVGILKN